MSAVTKEQLESMSKDALINLVLRQQQQQQTGSSQPQGGASQEGTSGKHPGPSLAQGNTTTTNNNKKARSNGKGGDGQGKRKKQKTKTAFDMSRFHRRFIALQLSYSGQDLHGFASQEQQDIQNTVETSLFNALIKVCLITDRASCYYTRCGRTDKKVSAMRQVISLLVRSNLTEGDFLVPPTDPTAAAQRKGDTSNEMDYVTMLNNVLPPEIRILGWSPVHPGFNARFDALHREYKYFFPKGTLNIAAMRQAASKFIGKHDFSNFCKMDAVNVSNFVRVMLGVSIQPVPTVGLVDQERRGDGDQDDSQYGPEHMYVLKLCGYAFLWHQVRCMMAVLFMVGEGKEDPSIVDKLLDVQALPGRPAYRPAPPQPLLLFDCGFEDLQFQRSQTAQRTLIRVLRREWIDLAYRAEIIRNTLQYVEEEVGTTVTAAQRPSGPTPAHEQFVVTEVRERNYIPMMERTRRDPYEDKVAQLIQKGKAPKGQRA